MLGSTLPLHHIAARTLCLGDSIGWHMPLVLNATEMRNPACSGLVPGAELSKKIQISYSKKLSLELRVCCCQQHRLRIEHAGGLGVELGNCLLHPLSLLLLLFRSQLLVLLFELLKVLLDQRLELVKQLEHIDRVGVVVVLRVREHVELELREARAADGCLAGELDRLQKTPM